MGKNSIGAEIGVYRGGFGEFLLLHCKKLYLVDPWYRLKPYWGEAKPENSSVRALLEIMKVYTTEMEKGTIELVVDFSIPFLNGLPAWHLDWVYLDASHSYEATLPELRACLRVVRKGGCIIGDDYDPDPKSKQHGVFRAVNEFLHANDFKLCLNNSRQWAFITE